MQKSILTFALIVSSVLSYAQGAKSNFKFDQAEFNRKAKIADWLYQYDQIAWISSDSVAAENAKEHTRLGEEWFCYQDARRAWHAIYGDYKNGQFDLVFHYTGNATKLKEVKTPVDTLILHRYARALNTASAELNAKYKKDLGDIKLNHYILKNPDKTYSVWFFPAYQSDGSIAYGGKFEYLVDSTGKRLMSDNTYFQGKFTKVKLEKKNKELEIDYTELEVPSLGGIFIAWTYKEYFQTVILKTKTSISTIDSKQANGKTTFVWQHMPNEEDPQEDNKSKKKK